MKKLEQIFTKLEWKISWAIILILVYIVVTNIIQMDKLHPWEPKSFKYDLFQKYANQSCFNIHPNYITFDSKEYRVTVNTGFEKRCNFTQAIVNLYVSDSFSYIIENMENLPVEKNFGNNNLMMTVNSTDMKADQYYQLILNFKIAKNFYNVFDLTTNGYEIKKFQMIFDNSIVGYNCELSSCIAVYKGALEKDEPLWRGHVKEFYFNSTDTILIRVSPISNGWFLVQKILDSTVLAIVGVLVYEIFWGNKKAKNAKKKGKKAKSNKIDTRKK